MWARIVDCFDLIFDRDVIKEQKEEDKQYEKLLAENGDLRHEIEVITLSRNRYLDNCKKKSAENKVLKKENKELKKKLNEVSL